MQNNVYQRMDNLHRRTTYPLSPDLEFEYELLDEEIETFMAAAELQCRKLRTGDIPWSPAYKRICLLLTYWFMRKDYSLGLHTNVRQLITLQNKLALEYNPNLSTTEIVTEIKLVCKQRKKIKIMANDLSIEYRTKLAMVKEEAGEMKAAVFLRNQNRIEEQRRVARNVRRMEGKIKGGSTTKVVIQDDIGDRVELVDKVEIERAMAAGNEKVGHQTEGGSQLLKPEFIKCLGNYGEGPDTDSVLRGTFQCPENTSDATKDFLDACKNSTKIDAVQTNDTVSTRYRNCMKLWGIRKEKTCTYGKHMGHYKAAMKHSWLSWLFFQKGEIPAMSGYTPKRHRKCVDLMITKKNNNFDYGAQ